MNKTFGDLSKSGTSPHTTSGTWLTREVLQEDESSSVENMTPKATTSDPLYARKALIDAKISELEKESLSKDHAELAPSTKLAQASLNTSSVSTVFSSHLLIRHQLDLNLH